MPKSCHDVDECASGKQDCSSNATCSNTNGSYTLKITNPSTVHKILHVKNGEKFTSDPFVISRVNFQLDIYPNGDKPEFEGYFIIY